MSIVNVILPDGTTYQTAEAIPSQTTTIINTIEERHEVTHTTEELNVPNVLVADFDKAYDDADNNIPDPLASISQNFGVLPEIQYGNRFKYSAGYTDHTNDNDPTTDSSAIKMYRDIFIQPPPNKPAGFEAPTLFTTGSIAVCGEGAIGYVPYSVSGQQIPNTQYRLGRGPNLGDRSHDNDGLMLQKQMDDGLIHKVHIAPDPTDPAILIESNRAGHFLKCVNTGPDLTATDENTVFSIDNAGNIHSIQLAELTTAAYGAEMMAQQLAVENEDINTALSQVIDWLNTIDSKVAGLEQIHRDRDNI